MLVCSYWFYRLMTPRAKRDSIDWVVGAVETASMIHQIADALESAKSVNLTSSLYYRFRYDYDHDHDHDQLTSAGRRFVFLRMTVLRPILLGRLMNLTRGFIYVAQSGFMFDGFDAREFEFKFLKSKGRKLGIYWCGSEIRSPKLMSELEQSMGQPNVFSYITQIAPEFGAEAHERILQKRAHVGNLYADVMFDCPTDQKSYLAGHREPFFYYMPPELFDDNLHKFDDLSRIVVTHASTSPIIKGTQLVRAAVAKLREGGYDFEYVELIGLGHDEVMKQLKRTHVALNQFFGFTTAVFGVEAMAARCAVLSSADETIETSLPPGANQATFVTKHWQVYDNLKSLLDHPERIEPLADAGQAWARRFASAEGAGALLKGILDSVLDGSYDKNARTLLTNAQIYGVEFIEDNSGKVTAK